MKRVKCNQCKKQWTKPDELTVQLSLCSNCRDIKDKKDWVDYTCKECERELKSGTRGWAERRICSNCLERCIMCEHKATRFGHGEPNDFCENCWRETNNDELREYGRDFDYYNFYKRYKNSLSEREANNFLELLKEEKLASRLERMHVGEKSKHWDNCTQCKENVGNNCPNYNSLLEEQKQENDKLKEEEYPQLPELRERTEKLINKIRTAKQKKTERELKIREQELEKQKVEEEAWIKDFVDKLKLNEPSFSEEAIAWKNASNQTELSAEESAVARQNGYEPKQITSKKYKHRLPYTLGKEISDKLIDNGYGVEDLAKLNWESPQRPTYHGLNALEHKKRHWSKSKCLVCEADYEYTIWNEWNNKKGKHDNYTSFLKNGQVNDVNNDEVKHRWLGGKLCSNECLENLKKYETAPLKKSEWKYEWTEREYIPWSGSDGMGLPPDQQYTRTDHYRCLTCKMGSTFTPEFCSWCEADHWEKILAKRNQVEKASRLEQQQTAQIQASSSLPYWKK